MKKQSRSPKLLEPAPQKTLVSPVVPPAPTPIPQAVIPVPMPSPPNVLSTPQEPQGISKLDEIAVNIEIVLISLIEGVALVTLAEHCVLALQEPDWFRYIPYVLGGFTILLVFWAQSISHAISFIRWPIRVEHMFLYFLSALIQIIAYTNILHIGTWFLWWSFFSLVAMGMYAVDLWILRDSYKNFAKLKGGTEFLERVEERHLFEMKYLVPAALAFNVFCVLAVFLVPGFFQNMFVYITPGILQFAFSCYALYDLTMNFRARSAMIAALMGDEGVRT